MFQFPQSKAEQAKTDHHTSLEALRAALTSPNRGAQFQLALASLQAARRTKYELEAQLNAAIVAHFNQPTTVAKADVERLEGELAQANVRVGDARNALEVERDKYRPRFQSAIEPGVVATKVTLTRMFDQLDEVITLLAEANNFASFNHVPAPPLVRDAPRMQDLVRSIRRIISGDSR